MDVDCEYALSRHQQPLALLKLEGDRAIAVLTLLLAVTLAKTKQRERVAFGLLFHAQLSSLFRTFRLPFHTFFLLLVQNLGIGDTYCSIIGDTFGRRYG